MRRIGYINATQRNPAKKQRQAIEMHNPSYIVEEGKLGEVWAHALQLLRSPGDVLIVSEVSVLARARKDLEKIASEIFNRGCGIIEAESSRETFDLAGFLMGLHAVTRKGQMTSEEGRARQKKSRGNSKPPSLWVKAKPLLVDRSRSIKSIAEELEVSPATINRLMKVRNFDRKVRPGRKRS